MDSREDKELPDNEFSEQLRKATRDIKFESYVDFSFNHALNESRKIYGNEDEEIQDKIDKILDEHKKEHGEDEE